MRIATGVETTTLNAIVDNKLKKLRPPNPRKLPTPSPIFKFVMDNYAEWIRIDRGDVRMSDPEAELLEEAVRQEQYVDIAKIPGQSALFIRCGDVPDELLVLMRAEL